MSFSWGGAMNGGIGVVKMKTFTARWRALGDWNLCSARQVATSQLVAECVRILAYSLVCCLLIISRVGHIHTFYSWYTGSFQNRLNRPFRICQSDIDLLFFRFLFWRDLLIRYLNLYFVYNRLWFLVKFAEVCLNKGNLFFCSSMKTLLINPILGKSCWCPEAQILLVQKS
jgi:hypothetical protein